MCSTHMKYPACAYPAIQWICALYIWRSILHTHREGFADAWESLVGWCDVVLRGWIWRWHCAGTNSNHNHHSFTQNSVKQCLRKKRRWKYWSPAQVRFDNTGYDVVQMPSNSVILSNSTYGWLWCHERQMNCLGSVVFYRPSCWRRWMHSANRQRSICRS